MVEESLVDLVHQLPLRGHQNQNVRIKRTESNISIKLQRVAVTVDVSDAIENILTAQSTRMGS